MECCSRCSHSSRVGSCTARKGIPVEEHVQAHLDNCVSLISSVKTILMTSRHSHTTSGLRLCHMLEVTSLPNWNLVHSSVHIVAGASYVTRSLVMIVASPGAVVLAALLRLCFFFLTVRHILPSGINQQVVNAVKNCL